MHAIRLIPLIRHLLLASVLCAAPSIVHETTQAAQMPVLESASLIDAMPAQTNGENVEALPTAADQQPSDSPRIGGAITLDEVRALRGALESLETKTPGQIEAIRLYGDAEMHFASGAEWLGTAAQFRTELEQAQAALAKIDQEHPAEAPVETSADATLETLQEQLSITTSALGAAEARLSELRAEADARAARRSEIPPRLGEIDIRMQDVAGEIEVISEGPLSPVADPIHSAHLAVLQAEEAALQAEQLSLRTELESYQARRDLLPKRIARWQARVDGYREQHRSLQALVTQKEERVAREAAQAAQEELAQIGTANPALRELAEMLARITQEQSTIAARRPEAAEEANRLSRWQLRALARRFSQARERTRAALSADVVDVYLSRERDELPSVAELQNRISDRSARISQATITLSDLEYEAERYGRDSRERDWQKNRVLRSITDSAVRAELEPEVDRLLQSIRATFPKLVADYDIYVGDLLRAQQAEQEMLALTLAFRDFINERILWMRSTRSIDAGDFTDAGNDLRTLTAPRRWLGAAQHLGRDALMLPVLSLIAIAAGICLLVLRPKLRNQLEGIGRDVEQVFTDRMALTFRALFITLALALLAPGVLWFLGWRLLAGSAGDDALFNQMIGAGLLRAGHILATLEILRVLCVEHGLADAHFNWREETRRGILRTLAWFEPIAVPIAFIVRAMEHTSGEAGAGGLGRFAFIIGMVLLALLIRRVLHPVRGIPSGALAKRPGGWLDRLRWVWYWAAVASPLVLGILAGAGYYYTSLQLELRLVRSFWLLLALILVHGLILRWLMQARRRLAIEEARKRRAEAEAEAVRAEVDGTPDAGEGATLVLEKPRLDIHAIDAQARKLIASVLGLALVLGVWFIWVEMLPALNALNRVQLYPRMTIVEDTPAVDAHVEALLQRTLAERDVAGNTGGTSSNGGSTATGSGTPSTGETPSTSAQSETKPSMSGTSDAGTPTESATNAASTESAVVNEDGAPRGLPTTILTGSVGREGAGGAQTVVTLGNVAVAVIVAIITFLLSRNLPGMLEITVLRRLPLEPSGRFAITTIARYALAMIGIVIAFGAIGIGWSKVQWLAAAITVGLGFGLQEIFANFVSGLIILFERPIRVGDTVTVNDISGTVTRIRIRATTITDWKRKELIIPNKEFVTGQIINWTLSDPVLRVDIPVGIAYGSDTALAQRLMVEVAEKHEHVLDDPPPRAFFLGFGDNALTFELRVFVPNIEFYLGVIHDMHSGIDQVFRKHEVEISFPQRDLHVRSVSDKVISALRGEAADILPAGAAIEPARGPDSRG